MVSEALQPKQREGSCTQGRQVPVLTGTVYSDPTALGLCFRKLPPCGQDNCFVCPVDSMPSAPQQNASEVTVCAFASLSSLPSVSWRDLSVLEGRQTDSMEETLSADT